VLFISLYIVALISLLADGLFSVLQVLLIYGITFGLSPFLFAFGDDAFAEFLSGIQFLVSVSPWCVNSSSFRSVPDAELTIDLACSQTQS
jgi:hypothetical protein